MMRGALIAIEGTDGSGSSTQCDLLVRWLKKMGRDVVLTKEPTRGPAGAMLQLALDRRLHGPNTRFFSSSGDREPAASELDFYTMALLYAADRMDHVCGLIAPKLAEGAVVVTDRYLLSTMAYQGLTVDLSWLMQINRFAPRPDITVFLDVPTSHTQARMRAARTTVEANDEPSKQERILSSYRRFISDNKEEIGPIRVVPSSGKKEDVHKRVVRVVSEALGMSKSSGTSDPHWRLL